MKRKLFISTAIAALVFTGCYYDKESELYGVAKPCDVGTVTFSTTVNGILNSNGCISCHSGSSPSGNISLQGYANVKAVAISGKLYGVVSHSPGFSPMPQGGSKISACDINKIKTWIDAGSPNN